jgi:hypothetical protein
MEWNGNTVRKTSHVDVSANHKKIFARKFGAFKDSCPFRDEGLVFYIKICAKSFGVVVFAQGMIFLI